MGTSGFKLLVQYVQYNQQTEESIKFRDMNE
jgi:hypothetical protein